MKNVFVRILYALVAIGFVVLAYLVVVWVLGMFGIHIPPQILTVSFVILGLLAAIWVLTGRVDNWFGPPGSPPV